jgi:hypothetical protein
MVSIDTYATNHSVCWLVRSLLLFTRSTRPSMSGDCSICTLGRISGAADPLLSQLASICAGIGSSFCATRRFGPRQGESFLLLSGCGGGPGIGCARRGHMHLQRSCMPVKANTRAPVTGSVRRVCHCIVWIETPWHVHLGKCENTRETRPTSHPLELPSQHPGPSRLGSLLLRMAHQHPSQHPSQRRCRRAVSVWHDCSNLTG